MGRATVDPHTVDQHAAAHAAGGAVLATTLGRRKSGKDVCEVWHYWLTDWQSQYGAGKAQVTPESVEAYWDTPEQRLVQPERAEREQPVVQLRRYLVYQR